MLHQRYTSIAVSNNCHLFFSLPYLPTYILHIRNAFSTGSQLVIGLVVLTLKVLCLCGKTFVFDGCTVDCAETLPEAPVHSL